VFVLVTRHFGGIKLGTGGLARAYGGAAREALRLSERQPVLTMARLKTVVHAPCVGILYQCVQDSSGSICSKIAGSYSQIHEEAFSTSKVSEKGDDGRLVDVYSADVVVPRHMVDSFSTHLRDSCRGRAIITEVND